MAAATTRVSGKQNGLPGRLSLLTAGILGFSLLILLVSTQASPGLWLLGAFLTAAAAFLMHRMAKRWVARPLNDIEKTLREPDSGVGTRIPLEVSGEIRALWEAAAAVCQALAEQKRLRVELSERLSQCASPLLEGARQETRRAMGVLEAVESASSAVEAMQGSMEDVVKRAERLASRAEETSASVLQMSASIQEVASSAGVLATSVEESTASLVEMGAAIRQINESVEHLSQAADRTVSAVGQIETSVREVEAGARSSARIAEKVNNEATEVGMMAVVDTIDGMEKVQEAVRGLSGTIQRLQGRAHEVGKILQVISEVTDRTTLLALNAAILAAQAGEHGRGFGVVADEIKDLAERTAASAQEISEIIQGVQQETQDATRAMDRGVGLVEQATRLALEAGEALRQIQASAREATERARMMERATAEQARGVREVMEAMARVNEMVEQIARALREQRTGSETLMAAAERIRDVTRQVERAVSEQAGGSQQIAQAMEEVTSQIQAIFEAARIQKEGGERIAQAVNRMKDRAQEGVDAAIQMELNLQELAQAPGEGAPPARPQASLPSEVR